LLINDRKSPITRCSRSSRLNRVIRSIKEWFYPGHLNGLEFIYPKSQALEIAQHAREPIQAAGNVDLHDLASVTVEAIEPIRNGFATSAENVTKSETTPIASAQPSVTTENTETTPPVSQNEESTAIAQNTTTDTNVQSDKTTDTSSVTSQQTDQTALNQTAPNNTEEPRELPRTAGELPLIALIGALCIGAGVGMKVLSARS
jgi:hypothetical protein